MNTQLTYVNPAIQIVNQGVMKKLVSYYGLIGANQTRIATNWMIPAQHSFVTNKYGHACSDFESPFINNCNYDLAGDIMKQIYGERIITGTAQVEQNVCYKTNMGKITKI